MPLFTLLLLAAVLSGCTPPLNIHQYSRAPALWQQQNQQRYQLTQWLLRGRVAFQTADDGGVADLIWHQSKQAYTIQLNAPLGVGALELSSMAGGVMLSSSDGEQRFAADAESLLQDLQGWQLPVSGLRYWLLGVAVPGKKVELISWLENNQLHVMQQDGWHIEYRQYQQVGDLWLPRKIFMHRLDNSDIDVRVVIHRWSLENV